MPTTMTHIVVEQAGPDIAGSVELCERVHGMKSVTNPTWPVTGVLNHR